jgi:hypothetical protein
VPVTSAARWFVISLVVIGRGAFSSAIASVLGPEISGELNHLFNPRGCCESLYNYHRDSRIRLKLPGGVFVAGELAFRR